VEPAIAPSSSSPRPRVTAPWPAPNAAALRSLARSIPAVAPDDPPPLAAGSGAFVNPLRSMLALSAATRAVAAEPDLRAAVTALQREACALTQSREATVVVFDGAARAPRTITGSITSDEFCDIVTRVARRGRREVFESALVEPIGVAPCRAVLALWRPAGAAFEPHDISLLAALVGGVAATLHRLLGPSPR
jgi:hypothetical protein